MTVLFLVLPLALLFAGGALGAFIWAARRGQFDDLITPPLRMLQDADDLEVVEAARCETRRDTQK